MSFCVYILYSPKFDKFYIGQTENLEKRLLIHNEVSENSFTSKYRPWQLVYSLPGRDRALAMKIEKLIKAQKSKIFIHSLSIENAALI